MTTPATTTLPDGRTALANTGPGVHPAPNRRAVRAKAVIKEGEGRWVIAAQWPEYQVRDVTYFRGAATVIRSMERQDPFGPSTAVLHFPAVTFWDPGQGATEEMAIFRPGAAYDIYWDGAVPSTWPGGMNVWEGFAQSFEYTETGLDVTLVGAMYQLDLYLAKPEYALQPFPYEVAIARQFKDKPHLRLKPLQIDTAGFTQTYTPVAGQSPVMVPTGVVAGQRWSGLVTRDTGSWDKVLTGYIQPLLTSWVTKTGRWTMDLLPGRQPVLKHVVRRTTTTPRSADEITISPAQPGVTIRLVEDHTNSANVFYAQSKALSGEAYSGMRVIEDGLATVYDPVAFYKSVHPVPGTLGFGDNPDFRTDLAWMRREAKLDATQGLYADEMRELGEYHLQNFSDPGYVGTITLASDVYYAEFPFHRSVILPGMVVRLPRYGNDQVGILLTITGTSWNGEDGTMTLTVDSKARDALTVDEVRLRGRDALNVPRMLIGGRYTPTLPDQLFPWNYAEGSGYIPGGEVYNARRLFAGMPHDVDFPWTEWTTTRPPGNASWRNCYIGIPAKSANANNNWAWTNRKPSASSVAGPYGIPVRMSQAGTIRLLQLAAYDRNGNVLKVPFHFSIYYQPGVNVQNMPKIPAAWGGTARAGGHATGERYPFFPQAWEQYNIDGTRVGTEVPVAVRTAGLIQGWGNELVPAGYWPGTKLDGDLPTGLLVDEEPWDYDLVGKTPHIGQYRVNDVSVYAGYLYVMIYCEAPQEVFFLGRMYRTEPGAIV